MSETKTFHLYNILSISTGKLSPFRMDGVYKILNYMTGDDLSTTQLPRVADECKPYLLMEMPWLAAIDASAVNRSNVDTWFAKQVELYGEWHEVRPIHPEDHLIIDPVEELKQMGIDDDDIIEVNL